MKLTSVANFLQKKATIRSKESEKTTDTRAETYERTLAKENNKKTQKYMESARKILESLSKNESLAKKLRITDVTTERKIDQKRK